MQTQCSTSLPSDSVTRPVDAHQSAPFCVKCPPLVEHVAGQLDIAVLAHARACEHLIHGAHRLVRRREAPKTVPLTRTHQLACGWFGRFQGSDRPSTPRLHSGISRSWPLPHSAPPAGSSNRAACTQPPLCPRSTPAHPRPESRSTIFEATPCFPQSAGIKPKFTTFRKEWDPPRTSAQGLASWAFGPSKALRRTRLIKAWPDFIVSALEVGPGKNK